MNSPLSTLRVLVLSLLVAVFATAAGASETTTQTFTLVPGWNAIFLEVEPPDPDPDVVFQGVPVRSVWTWRARLTSLEFVADASEEQLRTTGWLGYFPPNRPDAFLSNLKRIQANRAYLVKLGGTTNVQLQVNGRPSWLRQRWQPDAFNLVGVGVGATPPTFEHYFAPSPAHAGQPVYRLDPGGSWRLAVPSEVMRAGESFWVFCSGASDYGGPFDVRYGVGDGLDFGSVGSSADLELTNRRPTAATMTVTIVSESHAGVLQQEANSIATVDWEPLATTTSLPIGGLGSGRIQLEPRRENLAGTSYRALLEISDGAVRRWLPVRVDGVGVTTLADGSLRGPSGSQHAGLWIGTVTIDKVAEVSGGSVLAPTPTPAPFEARLILHVDESGAVRLLPEVLQMWVDGSTVAVPGTGNSETATPGRYIQITDKALLGDPRVEGGELRGNQRVGRRVSTTFYDSDTFDSGGAEVGSGAWGGALTFTLELNALHPTNPFRHRYHPDHNDAADSYAVVRAMTLTFGAPPAEAPPDWGTAQVAGSYSETLTGLHRLGLTVEGTFVLQRFSHDGVLDPVLGP